MAMDTSHVVDEVEVPEVSVSAAETSVQIPEETEEPEPYVGVTENRPQLPVVVVGPEHTEDSGTFLEIVQI